MDCEKSTKVSDAAIHIELTKEPFSVIGCLNLIYGTTDMQEKLEFFYIRAKQKQQRFSVILSVVLLESENEPPDDI